MLKNKLATLPMEPGCYLMKDKNGTVIYVGKAKKLKNRVSSYFTGVHNNKTTKLVENIADFDYIVAPSEKEAFILEYNLIKQYKPRFNIAFMDDKSYPYIRLTKEKYPTLKLVRDKKKMKNALYFGPYPNVLYARDLLNLLEKLYPLRKCKNIPAKVCLYYHIGLCLGPCEYEIDEETYTNICDSIVDFIHGNTKDIIAQLSAQRDELSEKLLFEKAAEKNELIKAIKAVTANQLMQSDTLKSSMDIFSYVVDKGYISITALLYQQGKLLHKHSRIEPIYDEPNDVFISYIYQYYQNNELPKELIVGKDADVSALTDLLQCNLIQPQRGDKVSLVKLAKENAAINLQQKFEILNKETTDQNEALNKLSKLLQCDVTRIELFDNSHISGSDAVAGRVVYIDGKPSKKDYRLYKVSNGNNDFANMKEVIYRRLFRSLKDETPLPDLIVVDGGMMQIQAAKEIVNSLDLKVRIAGLVKNDRHQTSELMNDAYELLEIDRESSLFYLLTGMQDEVHRFAISYHQRLRSKNATRSVLLDIEGVGVKNESKLKKVFGSLKKISQADFEQLHKVVDEKTAHNIIEYFKNEQSESSDESLCDDARFDF